MQSWQTTMKIHEVIADNRIKFAQRLNEMSEELANLAKEVDKNRKSVRLPSPPPPLSPPLHPSIPSLSVSHHLLSSVSRRWLVRSG